ncbi:bacteriocin [Marispirochaeta aestuarii]|uniref:Bacteriocin n=1 Tax=Marispirochaeta aestuarii TaxID=1963862 RepID=A0A1Y1RTG8_9SPIO|nr:family 1 encapsulin nanocompartment shell protein [Marispirochaeta aestuarii]ORC30726.1 bacteriocin [Marispirochaeta aestuarii]
MSILKRSLAPITDAAWEEIDTLARETLTANLSARRFVDVSGPHGLSFTSVDLGRLELVQDSKDGDLGYGTYKVQPLVEARIGFTLNIWELDNIERGARDIEMDSLVAAAAKMAAFEENAIYNGLKAGGITGLKEAASGETVPIKMNNDSVIDSLAEAQERMQAAGVEGGADLIVSPDLWKFLNRVSPGGSLKKLVERQIEGSVIRSEQLDGALLYANRGGDAELILGQDISVGYHNHTARDVSLFFTESFTFRILTPEALVCFSL